MKISYSRRERFAQIEDYLQVHQKATMRRIAKGLKMSPGGHLMGILWDMVDEGLLVANHEDHRRGWIVWHFELIYHPRLDVGKKKARK